MTQQVTTVPTVGRPQYATTNAVIAALAGRGRPLIVSHRGLGGGPIAENTAGAITTAVQLGADVVELDVIASTDGEFFCFHNGYEDVKFGLTSDIRTLSSAQLRELRYLDIDPASPTSRLQPLDGVLTDFADVVLNLDRSWDLWPTLLPHLADFDRASTLLLKAPVAAELLDQLEDAAQPFPFSPIVRTRAELEQVWVREGVNTVSVELLATGPDDELADRGYLAELRDRGLLIYLNALNLGNGIPLFCGWDDQVSLLSDPALGWGRLADLGADLIQTDWPVQLDRYLRSRG